MNKELKILLIGMGAIGGTIATILKERGYHIHVVVRTDEIANSIQKEGFCLSGKLGKKQVCIPASSSLEILEGLFDIVFIATKAYEASAIATKISNRLHEQSCVVTLQNGMILEEIGTIVGRKRTIGCVVGFGATLHHSTHAEITSFGEMVVGMLDNYHHPLMLEVVRMLEHVFPTTITQSILEYQYSKLIINSCISPLGAISGLQLRDLLRMRHARNIFINIMFEAMNVAKAIGITVPAYAGKLDYNKLTKSSGYFALLRLHTIIRIFGYKYRRLKSSSLQSLEKKKKTEIDYLNGYIRNKGRLVGVDTPICNRLIEMIHEIEDSKRSIDIANLYDTTFINIYNA